MTRSTETPEIAIVGGGIVGLVLAAGLTRRGVQVKLFEQARNFREIGAGIGFTRNTVNCMEKISPGIVRALRSGGSVNVSLDQTDPKAYLRYINGYGIQREDDPMYQKPLLRLDAGVKGWETVRRDQFLDDLVKEIPEGVIHLQKKLSMIVDEEDRDKVVLQFTDGTSVQADAGLSFPALIKLQLKANSNQSSLPTVSNLLREDSSSEKITQHRTRSTATKSPIEHSFPWTRSPLPSANTRPTNSTCTLDQTRT